MSKKNKKSDINANGNVSNHDNNNNNNNMTSNEVEMLERQLAEARRRKSEQDTAHRAAMSSLAATLPAQFGVPTLADVVREIRAVMRAQGSSGGGRRLLSDEQKSGIRDALTSATETSENIATRFGVSIPTVQAIKKSLGLVKARAPKTVTV
jgi:hypothetical protein